MKKEIKKTKDFNISIFEILDSGGNTLLKGGFSTVYDEYLISGGKVVAATIIINNAASLCDCVVVNNNVAGCACSSGGTAV